MYRLIAEQPGRPNVQRVPATNKGDWGIDLFCREEGTVYQCYCPREPYTATQHYKKCRTKITTDIAKLKKNEAALLQLSEPYWIRTWALAIPTFEDKRLLSHAAKKAREIRALNLTPVSDHFTILIIDHNDLKERLASKNSYSTIEECIEILRPLLYRSNTVRSARRLTNIIDAASMHDYISPLERGLENRLEACLRGIETCLLEARIDPIQRFFELTIPNETPELAEMLGKVLTRLVTSAEATAPPTLAPNRPIFSFPRPRVFVGRKELAGSISTALSTNRMVTIFSAIGGLGKTTLACQVAARLQSQTAFPDGIIFVDMEEARDNEGALLKICKSLGISNRYSIAGILDHLGDRRPLIIIDNIENILRHDRANFRKTLLHLLDYTEACFLSTGRDFINIPDEKLFTLKPLMPEEARDLLHHHLELRLGSTASSIEPKDIESALELCDGVPLVIELVASWLPTLSLRTYLKQYKDFRIDSLRNPSLDSRDRLTDYEISTRFTYQLLSEPAQDLLRWIAALPASPRLSYLPSPKSGDRLSALHELISRSLVQEADSQAKALVPIKEAVRTMVTEDDTERVSACIVKGIPRESDALEDFVLEQHQNITWSLSNLLHSDETPWTLSHLEHIILSLEDLYTRAGLLNESKTILDAATSSFQKSGSPATFRLYCYKGNIERLLDDYSASESSYSDALQATELQGPERARVLVGQGNNQKQMQKYAAAHRSFSEALGISSSLGCEPALRGECLWGLANVEFATSQWEKARSSYAEALATFEKAAITPETLRGTIDCHKGLCDIHIKNRDLNLAEESIEKALAIYYEPYNELKNHFTEAKINQGLGDVKRLQFVEAKRFNLPERSYFEDAEKAYQKAVRIYMEMKAPLGEALSRYKLGELYVFSPHKKTESQSCFALAAEIFESCSNHLGLAKARLAMVKNGLVSEGPRRSLLERTFQLLGVFRDTCRSLYWQAEAHLTIAASRPAGKKNEINKDLAAAEELFSSLGRADKVAHLELVRRGNYDRFVAFWE